jgi:Protein of unknown function (DUF2281)
MGLYSREKAIARRLAELIYNKRRVNQQKSGDRVIFVAILVEVTIVTIRDTAIEKIQKLPESLVQEIIDFIDLVTRNQQAENQQPQDQQTQTGSASNKGDRSEAWEQWFKAVEQLEIAQELPPAADASEYQQHLLRKYQKQGLNL